MSESRVPPELRYTTDHEWARVEGDDVVSVGITDFAQDALGEVTFVELPEVGVTLRAGDSMGVVESVKTFSDLYAPVSGTVVEVHEALADDATPINESPYGDGWIVKIQMSDATELDKLLSAEAYVAHLAES